MPNPQSSSPSPDSSEIDELVHLLGCQNLTEATNADRKGELISFIEETEPEIRQKLEALMVQADLRGYNRGYAVIRRAKTSEEYCPNCLQVMEGESLND